MKTLVFGADGWLGGRFVAYLRSAGWQVWGAGRRFDITSGSALALVEMLRPTVIINAAGKTHSARIPNVDGCIETEEEREATFNANAVGAGALAHAAASVGARFVHLSSGCIFNGGLFSETDEPNPVNWYGETKLEGERLVSIADPYALILRIRMPISSQPHPRNLITKLAAAPTVIDVVNSVTVVEDLLLWTRNLIELGASGIVHAVHPEPVSFRTLMWWYREIVDPTYAAIFADKRDYRTVDGRSNCVLRSIRQDVPALPPAEVAIRCALRDYAARLVCT